MATLADPNGPVKLPNFPGPIGTKRRRMRSGGNVSTQSNNTPVSFQNADPADDDSENVSDQKVSQTSKCKGTTTIPIFLKKTYKMIDTCDPSIASWTPEGDMFVVKDPDVFATQVIPQYFDHNKFSSFARQLNFYGFRKMQSKPIRNSDFDEGTAKHVTFYNENFKRGRCDLLKKIQRSTRGGGTTGTQDHQREIQNLRDQVSTLEQKITDMSSQFEERVRRLELEMLNRMEQMMVTVQQQQQQAQLQKAASVGSQHTQSNGNANNTNSGGSVAGVAQGWDANSFAFPGHTSSMNPTVHSVGNTMNGVPSFSSLDAVNGLNRLASMNSLNNANNIAANNLAALQFQQPEQQRQPMAAPSLPPHPKQKSLPPPPAGISNMSAPLDRFNSLRGISQQLTRGLSGLTRGASIESTASAVLFRNSWEDKLFSSLMLDGGDQSHATVDNNMVPTPIGGQMFVNSGMQQGMSAGMKQNQSGPVTVSDRSVDVERNKHNHDEADLSSVSDSEMA